MGDDRAAKASLGALLRVPVAPLEAGRTTLDAETARYVTRVHRLGEGDVFVAFDPTRAVEARATITRGGGAVEIDVADVARSTHLPPRAITLFQGIPKGGKIDDIVRDATELGVRRVVLVTCARSQGSTTPRVDRLARVALEAARQCGRGDVPEIVAAVGFDTLGGVTGTRIAMAPDAEGTFADAVPDDGGPVAILIGPEGGLDPSEIASLRQWGFGLVRLGPFVMRTETAAAAALGAIWSHFDGAFTTRAASIDRAKIP